MPNYCANQLFVEGAPEAIKALIAENPSLDMNLVIPCPNDSADAQSEAWGTKWGTCSTTYRLINKGKVVYEYTTAWGPLNHAVLLALVARDGIRKITMRYAEAGMLFCGTTVAQNGEVRIVEERDVNTDEYDEDTGEFSGPYAELFECSY